MTSCSEGPQVCCYLVFLLAASLFFDCLMSKFTCRQTRQGRKSDDWRETQLPWTTLWAERVAIDVVQEARPYDIETHIAYLTWYVPRTRSSLTSAPPQRPTEVTHDAAVRAGPDTHRAARQDETVKYSSQFLCTGNTSHLFSVSLQLDRL